MPYLHPACLRGPTFDAIKLSAARIAVRASWLLVTVTIGFSGAIALAAQRQESREIAIDVSQEPVAAEAGRRVGAVEFVGRATNVSGRAFMLQALELQGGFAGSGFVFPCRVERWNPVRRAWITETQAALSDDQRGDVKPYQLRPGRKIVPCSRVFHSVAGEAAARFRFRLWSN